MSEQGGAIGAAFFVVGAEVDQSLSGPVNARHAANAGNRENPGTPAMLLSPCGAPAQCSSRKPGMFWQQFDWWVYLGWWVINIPVPVALPLLVLYLAGRFSTPPSRSHALKSIGKGEIFWAAMAMAAAAASELYALRLTFTNPNYQGSAAAGMFVMLVVILFSVVYVAFGSTIPAASGASPVPNLDIYRASLWVLGFTILAYSASHFVLMAQEVALNIEAQGAAEKEKAAIIKHVTTCLAGPKGNNNPRRCVEDQQ
jgi:hypothetical protein